MSIIPARGGSKGLPGKNIIDLAGKPLIAWTIEASLKSKYITKTIVSSDNNNILEISKKFGVETIKRPDELALDTTPTEPVIEHVLKSLENIEQYDYLILLQPTSPLRDEKDIDSAIKLLIQKKVSALISTKEIDNKILKAFKNNENGYLEGIANNKYPFMRRQDLPKTFMPNGAIYIVSVKDFLKTKRLFTDKTISFEMSEEKSFDIDTKEDLNKCNDILNRNIN
ncbi:acylneuraminate cytidylyltransferase family protein [Aliarcobacter butzleri]|uniref:Acylneuraminate cytidylyltransferase family protein n=1 Tax=Aliarcobacter butzleri TaxID=28197 RepID=A0AAP4PY48_9BACT|nr:acylneuraminate cytidylyltransferase family protein [Aliarcobacter butzleri]MCT7556237.1 acylneuraminate cytidylyltransferase family protein [Aliarcobacter butzleri]MCT7597946.1 acylneuraminate cytidylyltransferase family protein [Aliarcobacter butzleri]MDK2083429.1 acylneuraminate cytidylyltransferase family protein [Aliarcobacter butzleri]MDN5051953.1 acylneuraminate cytidylyltransferase family protein [Aliarcobacter butzleri]MDN5074648.1 acylneuraminate cytidylyltransferase family protei